MHYNPFSYVHSEKDILKLVTTLMTNTKGDGSGGDPFWEKSERLLLTALIAYLHYEAPKEEQNFSTLLEMLNTMQVSEDDEDFQNPVDLLFEDLAKRKPNSFAGRQYKLYKLAAGVVCSKRLLNQAVGKSLRTHNLKPKKGAQVMRKNEKITALYERLSRDDFGKDDDQQRESNSISNQKAMLEDFAARQGFTNIVHFTDDGISGTCFDRPGFLAMMKEVEAGNVEYLCIKDMSRMGRDYLKVGQIMEILRQRGVRLIAINDGVDSARGDDDFTPFRNIMNEYYARDTSRKIRSTFQSKGKSGKHLTGTVIYGYLWNEARDQWLVDPEAAEVVKRIFAMTIEGYGPYQIASKLKEEKILIPSAYLAQHGEGVNKNKTFTDVYGWGSSTICNLLEKREYLGHTINFKTRKHFKDKKSHYVPEDEWTIFENTHEAINDDDGRGRVLNWVTEKYGQEKVAHIITYGTMATKLAIKDVARVQKLPLSESDRLCKLVPDKIPDKKMNLPNAIAYVPELQAAEVSPDPILRDTIKYAKMLEGNVRNTGVHACGTIICRDDITDWVPVSTADDKETGEKMLVTQYEGSVIEDTGLIKMDFLGLKTLSIIKEAVENIKHSKGIVLDIDEVDIEDPATYELYSDGRTIGTFQFESAGMQKYLRELEPSTFEDLIAMNALYRPGPMDYIPDFIDRKHGRKPIEYDIPIMEKYLKDTYGITVYQEQVMLLSRLLADFTRGESDALRKAMGKKLRDKLDHMKPKFISGGQKNGHDPKVLEKIWADWEKFASYAFNKSHATCYSWVAYQTAYLKANYPAEYMAATMSRNISNITEITKLMDESKATGITTKGPDVNESYLKFSVNRKGDIRFGLGAIKGVGESAVHSILEERERNGEYKDIFDFVQRVNLSACNRKNIENLALAGAFDSFPGIKREDFFVKNAKDETFTEVLVRYGNKYQMDKAAASNSLFGGENQIEVATPEIVPAPTWGDLERLNKERDLVGIYLSAHPLDEYAVILENVCNTHMIELTDLTPLQNKDVTMGGIVTGVREGYTKTGKPYGIAKIEDYSGSAEFAFFGNEWVEKKNFFMNGMFLFLRGKCQPKQWRQEEWEIKINSIELLPEVKEKIIEKLTVTAPLSAIDEEMIEEFTALVKANPGNAELYFHVQDEDGQMYVNLMSRVVKIAVQKDIMTYLKSQPMLSYKIN